MTSIDNFDYELPKELIAQQPMRCRSDARLLLIERAANRWSHHHIRDLPDILRRGDMLVVNDTQVLPARLVGVRTATGGRWSGLFLREDENGNWLILSKTRGKLQADETVTLEDQSGRGGVRLRLLTKLEGGHWVAHPESKSGLVEILETFGRVPLPPYIRQGEMNEDDRTSYQTVFASQPGAIAAPTAGLHFTSELMAQLSNDGVEFCQVTLHVGEGTFAPISVDDLSDHVMHKEYGRLTPETAAELSTAREQGRRVIAVGTTSTRVLESAAQAQQLQAWEGMTDLFIVPPYEFQAIDGLLTNFHLPKSTLLALVYAFGGKELMRAAYQAAIDERYRFYSYGDAMLII